MTLTGSAHADATVALSQAQAELSFWNGGPVLNAVKHDAVNYTQDEVDTAAGFSI